MIIRNAYVVDPANKREGVFDIEIENGRIKKVAKETGARSANTLDAGRKIVAPGLIDMHAHLREPGREDMETVRSGTLAALAGGFTSVCAMPNTYPPIDDQRKLAGLQAIIKRDAVVNAYPMGAITSGRMGREVVDMVPMRAAGVAAFTDDGHPVDSEDIFLEALHAADKSGALIISHSEKRELSGRGVVNEGIVATKLGLRPLPRKAEYEAIERDIRLAGQAGAKIHIAHVSCKESVEIIMRAKRDGVAVTAEAAPHHFSLTDTCCETYDTRTKMKPPLRSKGDVEAIQAGLANGVIDAIASDHAPHGKHEKEIEFDQAAFGIIGLETSLALAVSNLVKPGLISWTRLIELMSVNPARILSLRNKGALTPGFDADLTIIDPQKEWTYTKESVVSKSKNSPFLDRRFTGKVTDVIVGGRRLLKDGELL